MKKKKEGIKHHFIPQFYLKYFTDNNGKYYFYNKKDGIYCKNPRTPKTSFFERNRNTIFKFGIDHNAVEDFYCNFENGFAKCMRYILSIKNHTEIIEIKEIISVLKYFIAFQFCRLPTNDDYFDNFILNYDYKKCRNLIVDSSGKNYFTNERIEQYKNDNEFKKYFKSLMLPYLLFNHLKQDDDIAKWQIFDLEYSYPGFSFLCSDAPIIYENINDLFLFNGNILLPLTKNKILIISKKSFLNKFDILFWEGINMVLYEQANQYLSVINKKELNIIINRYKIMEMLKMPSHNRENIFIFL